MLSRCVLLEKKCNSDTEERTCNDIGEPMYTNGDAPEHHEWYHPRDHLPQSTMRGE
jgi:hypothetical protein